MIVYAVHRRQWGTVGEVELLTASHDSAEAFAQAVSAEWPGNLVVSSRELDHAGDVRVMSVWTSGAKVQDFGPAGRWRKVDALPG